MKYNNDVIAELQGIVESGLDQVPIPYEKGNSIRLKNIVIRKHKNGYKLFDCQKNKFITVVFSKSAALAIAKSYVEKKKEHINPIINLDNDVNKHYMDALFAKRAYKIATDDIRKDTAEFKYDISKDKLWQSLELIERYIFDK